MAETPAQLKIEAGPVTGFTDINSSPSVIPFKAIVI